MSARTVKLPLLTFADGRRGFSRAQLEDDPVIFEFYLRFRSCFIGNPEHDYVILQEEPGATGDYYVRAVVTMPEYTRYRRRQIAELRPYTPGESLEGVSISDADKEAGSPKEGDMIARNPKNHADRWLVSVAYFLENFEAVP